MNLQSLLSKWKLDKLKINAIYVEAEFSFNKADKKAAWEMYIELLTRVTTQYLQPEHGDEKTALISVYSLFSITREVLKKHGSECVEFAKIAIIVLNQIIRPFTAKWHKKSLENAFEIRSECILFREDLRKLQIDLRKYTKLLSDIAGVEDLTNLEKQDY